MNNQCLSAGTFHCAPPTRNSGTRSVARVYSYDAAALAAARSRLMAASRKYSRRLTNQNYYEKGRGEETICGLSDVHSFDVLVTRNHYGSLVLNAHRALFIDVDVLHETLHTANVDESHDIQLSAWQTTCDDLRTVLASENGIGFRIYRTAAGYRVLATTHEFEPGSRSARRVMTAAGADRAFVRLCRAQRTFRARLTPKPWRCGVTPPPNRFPRSRADERHRFGEWLEQYRSASRDRATCQFLERVGPQKTHDHISAVIELHDRETKAFEALPLA